MQSTRRTSSNYGNNYLDSTKPEGEDGSGCDGGPVQPWELNPYRLISWLEMLQFSADAFYWCGGALRAIRCDCIIAAATCADGEPDFLMVREVDAKAKDKALKSLTSIEGEFRKIGLKITADTVIELTEELKSTTLNRNLQWLHGQIEAIERLSYKELKNKFFLYIPPERAKFFPTNVNPRVFGEPVDTAFPSAIYDIYESAMCLALARSSASVFHLMRVLEIGLTALGKVFGVSLAHTNWEPAIREIESKIREMHKEPTWKALPDCKEQQEFYSKAASNFAIFKDAWRNHAMHVRGKYTEDESEMIFLGVKSFMQKLAERLRE